MLSLQAIQNAAEVSWKPKQFNHCHVLWWDAAAYEALYRLQGGGGLAQQHLGSSWAEFEVEVQPDGGPDHGVRWGAGTRVRTVRWHIDPIKVRSRVAVQVT